MEKNIGIQKHAGKVSNIAFLFLARNVKTGYLSLLLQKAKRPFGSFESGSSRSKSCFCTNPDPQYILPPLDMTIRVIVTVIYSKESHLDIQSFKNILLKMNHTFSKIERKIGLYVSTISEWNFHLQITVDRLQSPWCIKAI